MGTDLKTNILSVKYKNSYILDEVAALLGIDFKTYLAENKPYLSSAQTAELIGEGFVVGSHSIDHPPFEQLSLEEQIQQVKESLNILREQFNIPYNAFAFPFNERGVSKVFYDKTHFNGDIELSLGTSGFQKGNCANNIERQSMEVGRDSAKTIYTRLFREEIILQIRKKI